jgi:hypothetical protein
MVEEVKAENKDNPKEKTAPGSLFDNILDKVKRASEEHKAKDIPNLIDEAKKENRDNPKERTAEPSIFDKLKKMVEDKQCEAEKIRQNEIEAEAARRREEEMKELMREKRQLFKEVPKKQKGEWKDQFFDEDMKLRKEMKDIGEEFKRRLRERGKAFVENNDERRAYRQERRKNRGRGRRWNG